MDTRKAANGRPRSPIDGARLKSLRESANLTLTELARAVYQRAGKPLVGDAGLKLAAYRWEARGAIDARSLAHLASVLKTTVAVLRGEPALSIAEQLADRIRHQMAQGASAELIAALESFKDEESPESALARSLARRLEAAQMTGAADEFNYLSLLTGLTPVELRRPVSERGHWVFIATGMTGKQRHEILYGVNEVTYEVVKEMSQYLDARDESDARVRFSADRHWFHVSLERSENPIFHRRLQFSRCQADENGFRWCKATFQDRYFIDMLVDEARKLANFVTGLDGAEEPRDLSNLCLVAIRPAESLPNQHATKATGEIADAAQPSEAPVLSISLELDEFLRDRLNVFCREGTGHYAAVNWLTSDVWERLFPHLAPWPLEYWEVRSWGRSLGLFLELPLAELRRAIQNGLNPPSGPSLLLGLYEAHPGGSLRRVPWSTKSIEQARARLNDLKAHCGDT